MKGHTAVDQEYIIMAELFFFQVSRLSFFSDSDKSTSSVHLQISITDSNINTVTST